MAGAARVGDLSFGIDAHNCIRCPHPVVGPAVMGAPTVLVNGRPAHRIGDTGVHAACCRANRWTAIMGSPTVLAGGRPMTRLGDPTLHCGGPGVVVMGSPNVLVGLMSPGISLTGDGISDGEDRAGSDGRGPVLDLSSRKDTADGDSDACLAPWMLEQQPVLAQAQALRDEATQRADQLAQTRSLELDLANLLGLEGAGAALAGGLHLLPEARSPSLQKVSSRLGTGSSILGTAIAIAQLPENLSTVSDATQAGYERWGAASGLITVASGTAEGLQALQDVLDRRAVGDAMRAANSTLDPAVARAVSAEVLARGKQAALESKALNSKQTRRAVKSILTTETRAAAGSLPAASRSARMKAGKLATGAVDAAIKTAATRTTTLLARSSSRLVPGLNIAVAAADTAALYYTRQAYARGEVGIGTLIFSGAKATVSWVAASNVPVVSQATGAVGVGMDVGGLVSEGVAGALQNEDQDP